MANCFLFAQWLAGGERCTAKDGWLCQAVLLALSQIEPRHLCDAGRIKAAQTAEKASEAGNGRCPKR
jgi:hypothetical protein